MFKKNNNTPVRDLPIHSNETHPVVENKHYHKQVVVVIISLVAIILAALLLMFAGKFVGKAITQPATITENSFGVLLTDNTIAANTPFDLIVKANIGTKKTVALGFEMTVSEGMTHPTITSLLNFDEGGLVVNTSLWDQNTYTFEQATIFPDDAETGNFDILNLSFPQGITASGQINFSNLVLIDLDTGNAIPLTINNATIVVTGSGEVIYILGTGMNFTTPIFNDNTFSTKIIATSDLPATKAYIVLRQEDNIVFLLNTTTISTLTAGNEYNITLTNPNMNLVEAADVFVMDKFPDESWTVHGNVSKAKQQ